MLESDRLFYAIQKCSILTTPFKISFFIIDKQRKYTYNKGAKIMIGGFTACNVIIIYHIFSFVNDKVIIFYQIVALNKKERGILCVLG